MSVARKMENKLQEEENQKIFHKEKKNKSWNWHVAYYRKQIRDAKKQIERAEEKLNVAKVKAKEPEYKCVNGHDVCSFMIPGPHCPYCEKKN